MNVDTIVSSDFIPFVFILRHELHLYEARELRATPGAALPHCNFSSDYFVQFEWLQLIGHHGGRFRISSAKTSMLKRWVQAIRILKESFRF